MFKAYRSVLYAAVLILAFAPAARADDITLAELIATNGTITQGDKFFSEFSLTMTAQGPNTAPADASGIKVKGITSGGLNGLEFSGGMFAGVDSSLDLILSYKVTVLDPNLALSDIHLLFNGSTTGTGFTNITETVIAPDGFTVIGQATVTNPPKNLDETINLDQLVVSAFIKKDIFLFGGDDGTATITFVDQLFSQDQRPPQNIPEPASILLLGSGFGAIWARVRRRGTS